MKNKSQELQINDWILYLLKTKESKKKEENRKKNYFTIK